MSPPAELAGGEPVSSPTELAGDQPTEPAGPPTELAAARQCTDRMSTDTSGIW